MSRPMSAHQTSANPAMVTAQLLLSHGQPSAGNSVKQERHDEAEIRELAAQMVAANKAKATAASTRTPVRTQAQSLNILSFLNKTNNAKGKTETSTNNNSGSEMKAAVDEETLKGRFGWTTLGKYHIPYIFRGGDKYCAVRMVEMKVLSKYLTFLHQDIYNCTCIRSYYITEAESKLLNEINFMHCDSQFGRDQFTQRDLIVRLSDAHEFYKFLDACYCKLVNGSSNPLDRCGFIRINKESVVPYTIYNDQKYVPLFYFEGETDNLKLKANKLEGWDLSYLKFCCKVQGIRNELFAHDSCSVISLNDIKNYFPPGTEFEDYWPNKMVDSQLLINGKAQPQAAQWTRQPAQPPVSHPQSPKPINQSKVPNNQMQNVHAPSMYGNFLNAAQNPFQRPTNPTARATYTNNTQRQPRPTYYNSMAQGAAPPPLVRATQAGPTAYSTAQTTGTGNYMIPMEPTLAQSGYRQGTPNMQKYPPPLIPVRHINGGLRYETPQNHYGADVVDLSSVIGANNQNTHQQMINQHPAHQQSHQQQATHQTTHQGATMQQPPRVPSVNHDDRNNVSNGRQMTLNNAKKLVQIPDTPTGGTHIPYKMQKALVEAKMIHCINMKPFVYTEMLVTLTDLTAIFFNNVPAASCQHVLNVLGIELYKGNTQIMNVLLENGKCQSVNDVVPLVLVRNVIDYMPQLKYMLGGMTAEAAASSKRQMTNS